MKYGFHHTAEARAKISQAGMGRIFTEETKAKISKSHMGKTHTEETKAKLRGNKNALGCHRNEETKAKLRAINLGKHTSQETQAKMSKAAKVRWQNPVYWAKMSNIRKGRICTEETRIKMSFAGVGNKNSFGCHHTKETRAKLSVILKMKWQSPEFRARIIKASTGRIHTEETRARISQARMGIIFTEETRAKMSQVAKIHMSKNWQDIEFKDKRVKAMRLGCCVHPNKPEALLLGLLEGVYPGEWEFVGDGQLIIAGKNPDFWNGDHKLVELWGDYWHRGEDPQDRIDLFKHYGFSTLVIWEEELKYPDKVLERIVEFVRTPLRAE